VGRVAAGAVAKKLLAAGVEVAAYVNQLSGIEAEISPQGLQLSAQLP
jgi:chorismate synthase